MNRIIPRYAPAPCGGYLGKERALQRKGTVRAGRPQPGFKPRRTAETFCGRARRIRPPVRHRRAATPSTNAPSPTATASCFTWATSKPSRETCCAKPSAACRRSTPSSTASSPLASIPSEPRSLPTAPRTGRRSKKSIITTSASANKSTRARFADTQLLNVAIEHRLMHCETLAYMLHRLPLDQKIRSPSLAVPCSQPPAPNRDWKERTPASRSNQR